mmetsp:Transcript_2341/g.5849  ORF Transcript_2341/g.5849 Transcript_2341/m.5849 type:complete len:240 (+) Transcript_2341:94-813(+)
MAAPPSERVFIADLPAGTDEAAVNQIFGAYGNIKSCKYLTGKNCAIVEFQSVDEATWIVENLNGNLAQGLSAPVNCKYANPQGGGGGGAWAPAGGKGAGGNRWEPYGNGKGGKGGMGGKGGSIAVLKKGLQQAGVLPGGKWSNDQGALYVRGLPADTTNADLYEIFSPFGAIPAQGCWAMTAEDGTCKGYAFINFINDADAQNAIATLHGTMMPDGTTLTVQPKGAPKPKPAKGEGKGE